MKGHQFPSMIGDCLKHVAVGEALLFVLGYLLI